MLARRLYSTFAYGMTPLALARLMLKSGRNPAYRREIPQRFGYCPRLGPQNNRVWVHCVSVGETIAAAGMIRALLQDEGVDSVLVTSTTPTGAEQVFNLFGNQVDRAYLPFDIPGAVNRFLERTQPALVVLMETELWPNLIHACWNRDVRTLLANARLSERSARRYAMLPGFSRTMIRQVDHILAQTEEDRERFVDLGADPFRVNVSGSVKFDINLDESMQKRAGDYRDCWGPERPVWLAASTHAGEEDQVLQAHKEVLKSIPDALLVLVPRHKERFDEVSALVHREQLETVRQSQAKGQVSPHARVVVGDLLGELLAMLGGADMAFVGGSLVKRGGHNLIEPSAWALPVLTGPSNYNFQEISERLQAAGGLSLVADAASLAERVVTLFRNPQLRLKCGVAARRVVEESRGATVLHLSKIRELLEGH